MGDEDHGDALSGHAPDGVQKGLGLLLGEHGGGLVQNQQLQLVLAQLPGDLGELLVAHRHTADDHFGVDLHAHLLDGLGGAAVHLLVVQGVEPLAEDLGDHVSLLGLPVEEDILRGGEAGDQGELLVDHADARLQRVKGGVEHRLLAVEEDVALIAAGLPDHIHAEEDLHQCGLARAVLAAQAQDLALAQGKVDVGEDLVAEEVLLDASHLQQGSIWIAYRNHTLYLRYAEIFRDLYSQPQTPSGGRSFPCPPFSVVNTGCTGRRGEVHPPPSSHH